MDWHGRFETAYSNSRLVFLWEVLSSFGAVDEQACLSHEMLLLLKGKNSSFNCCCCQEHRLQLRNPCLLVWKHT